MNGYRKLKVGEKLQKTDEFSGAGKTWEKTMCEGLILNKNNTIGLYYRRPIKKVQRRIDLSGVIISTILSAIYAGSNNSMSAKDEIAKYFTKQICEFIANNYRRRQRSK